MQYSTHSFTHPLIVQDNMPPSNLVQCVFAVLPPTTIHAANNQEAN